MPSKKEIRQEVVEIVAEIAELSPSEVGPDARLEDLGIDSLNGLRIVAEMEKRYGITIPDDAIGKIRSMPDIFALVDAHSTEE